MDLERRHFPRGKLDQLAYISLQSGNGGIVLDVSEGGLGFHSAAPIETEKLIRFRLSIKATDNIEAMGELAWNDKTRRSGGLRFVNLSDELQEQIGIWLSPSQWVTGTRQSPPPTPEIQFVPGSSDHPGLSRVSQPASASRSSSNTSEQNFRDSRSTPVRHSIIGWRTALLLSLVVAVLGLSCGTLFFVRRSVQNYVHEETVADAHTSLLTAQAALQQNAAALSRKADLLATLVAMAAANDSTLQDSVDGPFVVEGSDLVALTDGANQITALHSTDLNMTATVAERLLLDSVQRGKLSDWWYVDGNLYQVVLESVDRSPLAQNRSGTVIVGRETDYATVRDLAGMSGSQVALSYDGEVVASTLNTVDRLELAQELHLQTIPEQFEIGQEQFYSGSLNLTTGPGPDVRLIVLKSYTQATTFLGRLNHVVVRLIEVTLIISFPLAILITSRSRNRFRFGAHRF